MLKRLFKSIAAITSGQFLGIVGNLALVPLFLFHWSTSVYGEWLALSAAVAYLFVSDMGMQAAAGNVLLDAYARRDLKRYRSMLGTAMAFYLTLALGLTLLLAFLTVFLPIPAWLGIHEIRPGAASTVILILGASILWQMPAGLLRNAYRSTGNLAATQWYWNLQFGGTLAVTAVVLSCGGGVIAIAIGTAMSPLLISAWILQDLRRTRPELLPSLKEVRLSVLRELFGPSLQFGLITLSMMLTLQGPILIISHQLGGVAVAVFVTTRTLANSLRQAVSALQNAIWPELTRLSALDAEETLRLAHRLFSTLAITVTASFAGMLWFIGGDVISVWTQGRIQPPPWLLRSFLIALVLQAPWLASSMIPTATNRHRQLSYSYFASAVISLTLTWFLLPHLGLVAAPVATIIGEAIACYHFVIRDACTILKENYGTYAWRTLLTTSSVPIASVLVALFSWQHAWGPTFLRWTEIAFFSVLAAGWTAWVGIYPVKDRSQILLLARSALRAPRTTPLSTTV